jgi:hypothetical protein
MVMNWDLAESSSGPTEALTTANANRVSYTFKSTDLLLERPLPWHFVLYSRPGECVTWPVIFVGILVSWTIHQLAN